MMLALLLQEPGAAGVARFFAAFAMIIIIFAVAWLFTYWISKDE